MISKIDVAAITAALHIPETEDSTILTQAQDQTLFEYDSEKYKTRIEKSCLKNPKKGASQLSEALFMANFNEELSNFIILLAHVMGFPSTNEFHF